MTDRKTSNKEKPRWRPEVIWFADAMERKLHINEHKGGWEGFEPEILLRRLREETNELKKVLSSHSGISSSCIPEPEKQRILDEAADVANFAMMIADVCHSDVRKLSNYQSPATEDELNFHKAWSTAAGEVTGLRHAEGIVMKAATAAFQNCHDDKAHALRALAKEIQTLLEESGKTLQSYINLSMAR